MMKVMLKRGLSVMLAFAMTLSVCMVSSTDVQAEELSEETTEEEAKTFNLDEPGEDETEKTNTTETQTGDSEQNISEELDELDQTPMVIDETGEDEDQDEDDQESTESVTAQYSLALEYDDHESLSDIMKDASIKEDLTEYPYIDIETTEVSSYKVDRGEKTTEKDEVAQYDKETGTLIATGIGKATVTFSTSEIDKDETKGTEGVDEENTDEVPDEETGDVVLEIEVSPATLTIMFIAGQSNAEGTTSSGTGTQYSVACEEGTVYSTYAPSSESTASRNTGISGLGACTVDNASSFVAGSLTGTTSLNGSELAYPLNTLTEAGSGKTGMDSGLAYQWHADTGDKVWVVNAGYSATSITSWIPGGSCYERAEVVYKDAVKTADAEVSSGHYKAGDRLLFWLQGESDTSMSTSTYMDDFKCMYQKFNNAGLGIEKFGIIMVRASTGSYTTSADLAMTGPRTAQYLLGNSSSDPDVYVVSNVNEQWVSDSKVASYFEEAYGSSLTYPQHSSSGLPTTVSDVHPDIHYTQVGHNENGITAAKNMYQLMYGGKSTPDTVNWYDPDGNTLSSGSTAYLETDGEDTYVPVAEPAYMSKGISVSGDSSSVKYDENTGTVSGSGVLTAEVGGVFSSLTVSSNELATPVLNKATCSNGEITVTWNSVSGASGYRVYRKPSGGSWAGIATTTNTDYVDSDKLETRTTYYYTVRAFKGEESQAFAHTYSSAYWSSYDKSGLSVKAISILSTPTLNKASASGDNITVTWNSVSSADGYQVYRKESGGSWAGIASTTGTSYSDTQVQGGTKYYYTVRAYQGNKEEAMNNKYYISYWSDYDSEGVSATASTSLSTPHLTKASTSNGSVVVTWNSVSGASGYRIYRKTSGGSWSTIGTTTSTSYTDTSKLDIGTTYYYTVRAYKGDYETASQNTYMAAYWSGYESAGVSAKVTGVLSTPTLSSAKSSGGSNTIAWNSVSGAGGYRVYRKPSGGSWAGIATTTSTSYTDTSNLSVGTIYYYTIRAFKGDWDTASKNTYDSHYWSDYDSSGVSIKTTGVLSTPSLSSAKTSNGSNIVTWKSVSGAGGYRVYRKTSSSSWAGIATTTSTSYTDDSKLDIGATYYYTVRAFKGDWDTASKNTYDSHYWSDYDSKGVSIKTEGVLSTPTLSSAKTSGGSNVVSWKSVSGAGGYRVYRKTSSSSWAGIATTTSTSYTDDSKLDIGATYYYTVRAFKGDWDTASKNTYDSHYWSGYDSKGVSVKTEGVLSTPTLSSAKTSGGSNIVSWKSVSGAGGYRVYRKTSSSSWVGIATTTSTSYTDDSKLDIGATYYYTVRAFKGDWDTASKNTYDSHYWSGYDSSGVSVKTAGVLSTPTLSSAKSSGGSNTITWKSVSGADGYRVYRKPSGGSWSGFATTTSTSYTDTSNLHVGTTYYYTVRAFKGDWDTASSNTYDSHYWSDYESGLSVKQTSQLSTPVLSKASASTAKITVTWNTVSNAEGYRVYRKMSGGSWNTIGTTTSTSYTDSTNLDAGTVYYYTVRAYKGDYTTAAANTYTTHYWSDYDSNGVSATAISVLSTPTLKSASKGSSGVTVTFGSVSGAGGYRVYRKVSGGSWSGIGNTDSTSYTDTSSLSSGKVYYYTVRAYVGDYSTASKHTFDVNYWSAFDTSGVKYSTATVADTDMYNKAQSYSSSSQYLIMVNTKKNKLGVFTGSKGDWEMKYYWSCSTGKSSTPTGTGTFKVGYKGKSFGDSHTCWYYTQFNGSQLMHSVLYKKGSQTVLVDGRLGMNISNGCVRLALENAKWIYNNVPKGSTVVGFK